MEVHPHYLNTEAYADSCKHRPLSGRHILAHSADATVTIYQAYRPEIAAASVAHQDFVTQNPLFNPGRMTWIKPGFLWMMYRCGWATKPRQERVLAVQLRCSWWEGMLHQAVLSHGQTPGTARQFDVVVQWDPDHDWHGGAMQARALQIGLRGAMAGEYAQGIRGPAVVSIEDITPYVAHMYSTVVQPSLEVHSSKGAGASSSMEELLSRLLVPVERVLEVPTSLRQVLCMDS